MKNPLVLLLAVLLVVSLLSGCGQAEAVKQPTNTPFETAAPTAMPTATPTTTPIPTPAPPKPLTGSQIQDGVYAITVKSSSSMFRIVDAQLTVQGGEMTAVLTMSGQGYGMLYMGTGKAATADAEESYIPFELDADGAKTFTVPVPALNQDVDCAAWSIKKEKWYDRVLVFNSDGIPASAILAE